ncbi:hypothetical protein RPMA_02260 [Tardiphaga alba]|uniref:DUF3108 domain-containing protein n=1 Tax=Tardiphaga alba TaxID=340268 RepID=A0ABX8A3D0_9BRAD|nr:hypothetical protein [Tardiphaga alba]QUS37817.1 hypothetical protein RPMA_02260 [Tardiphaga alba]
MRALVSILLLIASPVASHGTSAYRSGTVIDIKANTLLFQDQTTASTWRKLKAGRDERLLLDFERSVIATRTAWSFTRTVSTKVLRYDPAKPYLQVKLTSDGRMRGSVWILATEQLGSE